MSKQNKTTATALVATLNQQYKAIERNLRDIKTAADSEMDGDFYAAQDRGRKLDAAFEKTLAQLKEIGETVKFDEEHGEYFLGATKFRVQLTVVSKGTVEIDAPNAQIAILKAKNLADCDEIDLVEASASFHNLAEAV